MRKSSVFAYCIGLISLLVCVSSRAEHPIKSFKDIQWAEPKGFKLTTDIYVPEIKKKNLPVLIIFHGGGWLLNSKAIMTDMAQYMASNADLVVVNMNYRLLADVNNTTTANEIVEDALGAVLWVKDHIKQYGGNPKQIAITGDSAGGHLASMVMFAGRSLESDGFAGDTLGFKPTYLPKNKTAEQLAKKDGARVQAVTLSYTAFDLLDAAKNGFETSQNMFWKWANATPRGLFGAGITTEFHADFYKAVSPINYIPDSKKYKLPPQFVHVGSLDGLTTPQVAGHYVDLLKQNNQSVEFKIYEGRGHGFLDTGCNDYTGGCFKDLAVPTLKDMIVFLDKVFK
jgi:acetyl esterase